LYLNPKSGIYFNLVQNQEFILLKSKIRTLFYWNPKSESIPCGWWVWVIHTSDSYYNTNKLLCKTNSSTT